MKASTSSLAPRVQAEAQTHARRGGRCKHERKFVANGWLSTNPEPKFFGDCSDRPKSSTDNSRLGNPQPCDCLPPADGIVRAEQEPVRTNKATPIINPPSVHPKAAASLGRAAVTSTASCLARRAESHRHRTRRPSRGPRHLVGGHQTGGSQARLRPVTTPLGGGAFLRLARSFSPSAPRDYERLPTTLIGLRWLAFACLLLSNLFNTFSFNCMTDFRSLMVWAWWFPPLITRLEVSIVRQAQVRRALQPSTPKWSCLAR